MADSISNSDDIIDSRDVITRIDELTSERDDLQAAIDEAREELTGNPAGEEVALASVITEREQALADWMDDNGDELKELEALQEQAEGYTDWQHGATLIRESHFVDYCRELVDEIGDMPKGLPSYLANNINWEGVAEDLQVDYTSVEFGSVTYWVR